MRPTFRTLSKILPRSTIPESSIHAPPLPTLNRSRQPTVIDKLVARRDAALASGKPYPPNLRLETFKNIRASWQGVSKDVRRELKVVIKEK